MRVVLCDTFSYPMHGRSRVKSAARAATLLRRLQSISKGLNDLRPSNACERRYTMRHLLILTGTLPLIIAPALPANAAIHEMVAAFCSGGGVGVIDTNGFLEPPGVTTPGKESFRK